MKKIDLLIEAIKEKKSHVVVGLDPKLEEMPKEFIKKAKENNLSLSDVIFNFNKEVIDAVYDLVPAVKAQVAYYEMYGLEGLLAYKKTIEYAKSKKLIVIGDIKRSDIGSTSLAYSKAHIGSVYYNDKKVNDFAVDAVTINPFLGSDTLKEFEEDMTNEGAMMFVLVKTSNKSSGELQDLDSGGKKIYEHVAKLVSDMAKSHMGTNGYSGVGAVTGATYKEELINIRKLMPESYFLIPGYGAQGGVASDVVGGFNKDGLGAVINSSRGIIYAYKKYEKDIKESSRMAVIEMNRNINNALQEVDKIAWE
ncbi:MAG: orotidine-5'-phosphate decarboxylase [Acidaminobacteraceae bacterium]